MPRPKLAIVRDKPVDLAPDIYRDTRQLWRDEDRWRRMWVQADKAQAFATGGRG